MPPELFGPAGLLVALVLAVAALWRDHQHSVADVRKQRDRATDISEAQVAATLRVAEGQEVLAAAFREYVREQTSLRRQGDR